MNISKQLAVTLLAGVLMAIGCSQGVSLTTSEVNTSLSALSSQSTYHQLLGFYTFTCDPVAGTVDAIPLRGTQLHLNALKFLEPPPLVKLTIEGIPKFTGNILDVDIGLRNPYLALDEYTGFDVCGIVFTQGSQSGFSDTDIVMAGDGDTRLLNADGCTRWWNPREFPHGDKIFNYVDGMLGTPAMTADFNCSINGYKYFADGLGKDDPLTILDPAKRGLFSAGKKNIRHYKFDLSSGLTFNYAVDACWKMPTGTPPYTVPDDFPPGANKPEAWNVNITELENTLYSVDNTYIRGGILKLQVDVFDHFEAGLNEVYAESLTGLPLASALTPVGGGEGYSIYELEFTGENLARSGTADLLVAVQSEMTSYGGLLPGKPVSSYFQWSFSISPDPPPGWAVTWGGDYIGEDGCEDLAVDAEGNVYVTGWIRNEDGIPVLDFDPGPGEDIFAGYSPGAWHGYIAKFSGNGVYQWSRVWGGYEDTLPYWRVKPKGICTDSQGDIFVTGIFRGNVDFDPGPGVEVRSNKEFFLSKFDSNGQFQWVLTLDEGSHGGGYAVAVDSFDNIYAGGWFGNEADLAPGPEVDMHTATFNGRDLFITKFDNNGNFQWARTWGGPSIIGEHETIGGLAIDDSNNVWATGRFYSTVDFDPGPEAWIHTANALCDVYLTKFNADGDFQFAAAWGGNDRDTPGGIACGVGGDVYVVGSCSWGVDFDTGPGIDDEHKAGGRFLSKFDQQGTFQWVRIHDQFHCDVAADNNGNIYCAGEDPWDDDAHLIKYDQWGNLLWLREWSGTPADHVGCYCVDVNSAGDIYIAGAFMYTVDFNPGPGVDEHTSNGNCYDAYDAYLCKYPPDGNW